MVAAFFPLSSAAEMPQQREEVRPEEPSCFAESGHVDARIQQISKKMNPKRAYNNCPVTAFRTAGLLETGLVPKPPMRFPNLMKIPKSFQSLIKTWNSEVFEKLGPTRQYVHLDNVRKDTLDQIMQMFGSKTHAILAGKEKGRRGEMGFGHCFNYVLNRANGEEETSFLILDSYSPAYHDLGRLQPERFLDAYDGCFETIIFYESTQANEELASRYRK